jgi:hypothetical protein
VGNQLQRPNQALQPTVDRKNANHDFAWRGKRIWYYLLNIRNDFQMGVWQPANGEARCLDRKREFLIDVRRVKFR